MEIVSQPFLPVLIWLLSRSPSVHGSFNFSISFRGNALFIVIGLVCLWDKVSWGLAMSPAWTRTTITHTFVSIFRPESSLL